MGNNQGNGYSGTLQSDGQGDAHQDVDVEALKKTLRSLRAEELGCGFMTRKYFVERVFPDELDYGNLLYLQMREDAVGLDEKQFLAAGMKILSLTSGNQQLEYYFQVFSEGEEAINRETGTELFLTAYKLAWKPSILGYECLIPGLSLDQPIVQSVAENMFGGETMLSQGSFVYWANRHCPNIFQGVHAYTVAGLTTEYKPGYGLISEMGDDKPTRPRDTIKSVVADNVHMMSERQCTLSIPEAFLITSSIPSMYIPLADVPLSKHLPLAAAMSNSGWCLLYNSNNQGLSFNRFQHHVWDYKGPTIMVIEFTGFTFCLAIDQEWKESSQRWGGNNCTLIEILPQYRLIMNGAGMVYFNLQDRNVPKGIQVGKEARSLVLETNDDLTKVRHFGIEYALHSIEVWGCGGPDVRDAQVKQKNWQQKEINKAKDKKLKLEDWKDNPDRALLEMGGIQTEHAQR